MMKPVAQNITDGGADVRHSAQASHIAADVPEPAFSLYFPLKYLEYLIRSDRQNSVGFRLNIPIWLCVDISASASTLVSVEYAASAMLFKKTPTSSVDLNKTSLCEVMIKWHSVS